MVAEGRGLKMLTINEIVANSPASEAGLQEEDQLIAIDGQPASKLASSKSGKCSSRKARKTC